MLRQSTRKSRTHFLSSSGLSRIEACSCAVGILLAVVANLAKWRDGSLTGLGWWGARFFARLGKNAISVYEAPDMGLLDKRSVKLDMVQDFTWSPADPIL